MHARARLREGVVYAVDTPARTAYAMASSSSFPCSLCSSPFYLPTYRLWLGHLRHVHAHDSDFYVVCGVDSCPSTFRKFTTLYSHVYRKHRQMLETRTKSAVDTQSSMEEDDYATMDTADYEGEVLDFHAAKNIIIDNHNVCLLIFNRINSC